MKLEESIQIFKCLADHSRVQIVQSLMAEDMYVERLAERLNVTAPTVSFHLKKLEEAGLVSHYKDQYYTVYQLKKERLGQSLAELIGPEHSETALQEEREAAYRKKVLDAFFQDGRLKLIPAQRKKEHIILEKLGEAFEPDRIYEEKEVNLILAQFHDDFCTLRRDMIGDGILERKDGLYRLMFSKKK